MTDTVLTARRPEAERRGLSVHATLEPAESCGDQRLAERLVANLVDNALRHNQPHGRVDITTTTEAGRAVLSVANSGPRVPPDEVERLFQPFQRHGTERIDHGDGIGLGLSIVKAIATAHGASVAAEAQLDGGLDIEVSFLTVGAANGHVPVKSAEPTTRRALRWRRHKASGPDDLRSTEVGTVR